MRRAASDYGWLLALAVAALALIVVYTRPIAAIPATTEIKRVAPASPAGTVRLQVCEDARSVIVYTDHSIGADAYVVAGAVTLRWVDTPPANLAAETWNPKAILEGEVADITSDVIKCLYRRAERMSFSDLCGQGVDSCLPSGIGGFAPRALAPTLWFNIPRSYFLRMLAMEATGIWEWTYEQWQSGGDILAAIVGAFEDTSSRYGVYFTPSPSGQRNISASGSPFTARCGAGFAVACVGPDPPYYPLNCDAYYDGVFMVTFYFGSQKGVTKHEYQHCATRRAEGTPSGTWVEGCVPFPSVMGCGSGSPKEYTTLDDAAWAAEHYPQPASWAFVSREWDAIFYGLIPANDNGSQPATRVALIQCDSMRGCVWSGYYGPTSYGKTIEAMPLLNVGGACFYVKTENEISWRWSESVTFAGCVP